MHRRGRSKSTAPIREGTLALKGPLGRRFELHLQSWPEEIPVRALPLPSSRGIGPGTEYFVEVGPRLFAAFIIPPKGVAKAAFLFSAGPQKGVFAMKFYNTLTRQKDEFVPLEPGRVRMYACGPTVYDFMHIGNARPVCIFDTLRRYLEFRGYEVTYAQNFTDVDDKIINRANKEGVPAKEIAERYIREFMVDNEGLGIRPDIIHPKATETMDEIIATVQKLIDRGYAYESNGDVYFRALKDEGYGKLSHQPIEDLESGARISISEHKEDPLDFALWKAAKPGEPAWESPWGPGRPGWHIECTAMIHKHLGETIDIHCGGQDLVFPHHENEIAQSECCTGKPYVNYWLHNGHINVDNKKMSKSLGNFFTVREVAQKYGYEPIKYMMVSAHYRSPLNYSTAIIEQCRSALERLHNCRDHLDFSIKNGLDAATEGEDAFRAQVDARRAQFIEAMDDDLNTADGVAALFELARDINIFASQPRSKEALTYAAQLFDQLTGVLGLLYDRKTDDLDSEIEELIAQRQQARKEKNFALADKIRDDLKARGITLLDTPQGVKWKKD